MGRWSFRILRIIWCVDTLMIASVAFVALDEDADAMTSFSDAMTVTGVVDVSVARAGADGSGVGDITTL